MDLNQTTHPCLSPCRLPPSCGKVFTFAEELEEGTLHAHSYGNGRFIQGIPSEDCEVSFSLYKADENSLDIQIYDDNLFEWLRTIPDLRDGLDTNPLSISMNVLLPCYSEVRDRFAQYQREGHRLHSFDALELFFRHFLREGSVFAPFGFEYLQKKGILTELHYHDIQSQVRSISEDLDLLDEAIDKLEVECAEVSSRTLMKKPSRSQLRAAITRRDPFAVGKVLAIDPGGVDVKSLCLAIYHYEPTVFRLLLKHGARVEGLVPDDAPLYLAAKNGNMDAVRLLLSYGADKDGMCLWGHPTPVTGAASAGHLEIVKYLVEERGAEINGYRDSSPLFCAYMNQHDDVVDYLESADAKLDWNERVSDPTSISNLFSMCDGFEDEDLEDCPVVAAVRAQERRTTTRRLFAQLTSSRKELLDAGASQYASVSLREFVAQVGTVSSVFKSGTRAIRDISEGYKPSGLGAIVSALQVADAMRSVVPPSKLVYSKKEFLDDIPRWASLLSPDDQRLFDEIACHLWGISDLKIARKDATSFACEEALKETLTFLQELVNNLVRTSWLFDHDSGSSCDPYRLQSLRHKHLSARCNMRERRPPLTEWHPLPPPEVQKSVHGDEPKPPDPERETSTLARITVLMAGAVFGVILLYLWLSQYGFSIQSLPLLTSKTGHGWASSHTVVRNCVILAMYIRFMSESGVDSFNWKRNGNVLPNPSQTSVVVPENPTTESVQDHVVAGQSSYEGDDMMIDFTSMVDATMEDTLGNCSPSLPSHLTASTSATSTSASNVTTATPRSTTTSTSEDEKIRCDHCEKLFKLRDNGRGGKVSNLSKHMRRMHPDTIPGYQQVLYACRGCGTRDPDRSNIEAHELYFCAIPKGKRQRRHGKYN